MAPPGGPVLSRRRRQSGGSAGHSPGEQGRQPGRGQPLRRRAGWAVLAGLAVGLVAAPAGLLGPGPLAGPGSPPAGAAPKPHYYIVRPGDTLWSIAERLHPGADPRPAVAEMEAKLPPGPLVVGEQVVLPP